MIRYKLPVPSTSIIKNIGGGAKGIIWITRMVPKRVVTFACTKIGCGAQTTWKARYRGWATWKMNKFQYIMYYMYIWFSRRLDAHECDSTTTPSHLSAESKIHIIILPRRLMYIYIYYIWHNTLGPLCVYIRTYICTLYCNNEKRKTEFAVVELCYTR